MLRRVDYECCPLCGWDGETTTVAVGDSSQHPLHPEGLDPRMEWVKCPACTHVYVRAHLGEEARAAMLSLSSRSHGIGGLIELERERAINASMLDWVTTHTGTGGQWLDVGAGNGALLHTIEEYGFSPSAVELRPQAAKKIELDGFAVFEGDFNDIDFGSFFFHAISLCDVLEHFIDPKAALEKAYELLAHQGALVIATPNADCSLWRLYEEDNPYWNEVEHAHAFGRRRLALLLEDCGFDVLAFSISQRYRFGMRMLARKP